MRSSGEGRHRRLRLGGERHAHAFRATGARIAWAVDRDLARAAKIGAEQPTDDLRLALVDATLEAVCVCLPHALHAEVSIAAAAAGKHVLVEKPMADPFEAEVRHFIGCVREHLEPLTSGRSQRRTLELVVAAYESMASGAPVPVPVPVPS